ncbi:MAG: indolepyruvate oxidoreductase subunit beta [Oscillospiraceae bacterium]|jgi:indolepyruvate ferredoxin oxidoreductase beta subunit|nr:indolepyruvate oxidoreductase subunit beta [Oscillospiraceae bacterium]
MINIVIAGVGGQGSILAAKVLGSLYLSHGLDVKVNEVHGMSQRGGSVVTMVRAGEKVYSPLVSPGEADLLIGLECQEAMRAVPFLSPDGKAVISLRNIPIRQQQAGSASGSGVIGRDCLQIDALALAKEAGNPRCENVVLLGAASKFLNFTRDEWESAIREHIKPQHIEVNLKAFTLGEKAGEECL